MAANRDCGRLACSPPGPLGLSVPSRVMTSRGGASWIWSAPETASTGVQGGARRMLLFTTRRVWSRRGTCVGHALVAMRLRASAHSDSYTVLRSKNTRDSAQQACCIFGRSPPLTTARQTINDRWQTDKIGKHTLDTARLMTVLPGDCIGPGCAFACTADGSDRRIRRAWFRCS